MFAAEFQPRNDSRRRGARRAVSLDAELGQDGLRRALCRVVDISVHGARLQTYSALASGAVIWLSLPGAGLHAAEVKWSGDFTVGCEFITPLSAATFAALVAIDAIATRR